MFPLSTTANTFESFSRYAKQELTETRECLSTEMLLTLIKGGEIHDGSELIGPAEPLADSLADSLSDGSSDGKDASCF